MGEIAGEGESLRDEMRMVIGWEILKDEIFTTTKNARAWGQDYEGGYIEYW